MLYISDGVNTLSLSRDEARDLELKLNVSSKGHLWSAIGTALFDFHSVGSTKPIYYTVTAEQYEFLELLRTKAGYESCKGL
jgi:hypothetical protein